MNNNQTLKSCIQNILLVVDNEQDTKTKRQLISIEIEDYVNREIEKYLYKQSLNNLGTNLY